MSGVLTVHNVTREGRVVAKQYWYAGCEPGARPLIRVIMSRHFRGVVGAGFGADIFRMTRVRVDRAALRTDERAFWSTFRRLLRFERSARRDRGDLYRLLLILRRRLPDGLCGDVLQMVL